MVQKHYKIIHDSLILIYFSLTKCFGSTEHVFSSTSSTRICKLPAYSWLRRVICQWNLELQALNLNRAVVVDPKALLERISGSISNCIPRLLLLLLLSLACTDIPYPCPSSPEACCSPSVKCDDPKEPTYFQQTFGNPNL